MERKEGKPVVMSNFLAGLTALCSGMTFPGFARVYCVLTGLNRLGGERVGGRERETLGFKDTAGELREAFRL